MFRGKPIVREIDFCRPITHQTRLLALLVMLVNLHFVAAAKADYYSDHPAPPFHSTTLQEFAPVQKVAATFPGNRPWKMDQLPTIAVYRVAFSGKPGQPAAHEGMDFVHNSPKVPHVPVIAVAGGTIAYVRTGAPQDSMFKHNNALREAGAGWGNFVVVYHGNGIYTRYAHLAPDSVKCRVGDSVESGEVLGEMGNTGRSETRHLHLEVGFKSTYFAPGKPAQSFDLVLNPEKFFPSGPGVTSNPGLPSPRTFTSRRNEVRSGPAMTFPLVHVADHGIPFQILRQQGNWLNVEFLADDRMVTGWTHSCHSTW